MLQSSKAVKFETGLAHEKVRVVVPIFGQKWLLFVVQSTLLA
jgi:hypothetical protein